MRRESEKRSTAVRFGIALSSLRMKAGLTQEQLASRADLHRTYIADIERGKRNPSLATIVRLVSVFGLHLCVRNARHRCSPLLFPSRRFQRPIVTHRR